MIYNNPIWSPNVIVISNYSQVKNITQKMEKLIARILSDKPIISVVIDHAIQNQVENQLLLENVDYSIYQEKRNHAPVLSSVMLKIGAKYSYDIIPLPDKYRAAYVNLIDILGYNYPLICFTDKIVEEIDAAAIIEFDDTAVAKFPSRYTYEKFLTKRISFQNKSFKII